MGDLYTANGKSLEILQEEMYDLLAWIRDHDWTGLPETEAIIFVRNYQRPRGLVQMHIARFPNGDLEVTDGGVVLVVSHDLLAKKRPVKP